MTNLSRLAAAVIALASASAAQAQFYLLGPFDTPSSVTSSGIVAGYGAAEYFTWSVASGRDDIGGAIPGFGTGAIPRISESGNKVGATSVNGSTGLTEIASYNATSGQWTTYGGLGSSSGGSVSGGFGMNASGSVQVGLAWVNAGTAHAISVKNGVVTDLGSLVANRSSRADAVSNDGSFIGGFQDQQDGFRAGAVWIDGVEQVLSFNGNPLDAVNGISGNGEWAVGGGGFALDGAAYMWNPNSGLKPLDNPFAADGFSLTAMSVSFDGSVVVGYGDNALRDRIGWIWTEATGTMAMEDYAEEFAGYDGELLFAPLAVSQDGRHITGYGLDADFNSTGWLISTPVPEPSTWASLALGLGLLGFVRHRRRSAVRSAASEA